MRIIYRYLLIPALLLFLSPFVAAQTSVDLGVGLGKASADSTGLGIYDSTSSNAFASCTPGTGDSSCQATPSLGGLFLGFSGNVMLSRHYGFGGQLNFQPSKNDYGPLEYRQMFYDFNGIYAPINRDRFVVELQGGLGGAKTGFSYTQTSCIGTAVCSSYTESVGSSNHFQLHTGAGVKIFLTDYLFIQPQFDLRYVTNFTDQFGSNVVPSGTVWIGFSRPIY